MITATLCGDTLTVSGHAGYAPAGQDIVCAAVSTVLVLCERTLAAFGCAWREQDRGGTVTVTARGPGADLILRTAAETLRLLADRYPAHVRVAQGTAAARDAGAGGAAAAAPAAAKTGRIQT